MHFMRNLPLFILAGAFLLISQHGGAENLVFALVPKVMSNPFFDFARDGCKKAESELPGVECLYIGPSEHTAQEQIQIVQDLISRRVDGIAVSPSNAPALSSVLQRARATGIPVITWDADLLDRDKHLRATYVGTNNYQIGRNLAEVTMALKPEGGTICIQSGGAAAANHNERMQGLRDTLSGKKSAHPPGERLTGANGWTEVAGSPLYTNDDFPLSVQQMADIFVIHGELTAFVATGGFPKFVEKAYRRLVLKHEDRIRSKETVLVIADTLPFQMEILRDGLSHGQVGQRPYEMGYRAMFVLNLIIPCSTLQGSEKTPRRTTAGPEGQKAVDSP